MRLGPGFTPPIVGAFVTATTELLLVLGWAAILRSPPWRARAFWDRLSMVFAGIALTALVVYWGIYLRTSVGLALVAMAAQDGTLRCSVDSCHAVLRNGWMILSFGLPIVAASAVFSAICAIGRGAVWRAAGFALMLLPVLMAWTVATQAVWLTRMAEPESDFYRFFGRATAPCVVIGPPLSNRIGDVVRS